MNKYFRKLFGLEKQSDFVKKYLEERNIRSAVLMTIIVIILEIWMIISLGLTVMESAAAGKPRDFIWILNHGGWYVALLGAAIAVLVYALKYLRGKTYNLKRGRILLMIFSVVALVFGIHFGNNSYVHGDQAFAFVTMTLFVFGLLVWKPVAALVGSVVTFGGFYLLANSGAPANYGMQVNLFTLWISTFVVSLISYQQVITAARKSEQREEANAQLQKIADFDALTGIPSMHSFNRAVGVLFEGITEFNVDFSILYMDIEHFKAYNDKNGFGAGDKLLCDMAAGLMDVFKNELVARYSDDHFVALCETCVSEERALAANEVLKSLRGDVRLHLKTGIYEPSMNIEDIDVSHACDRARLACGEIKRHPGVCFKHYDKNMDTDIKRKQHVINNVKKAVSEGWIKVYYQPVVRCSDGSGGLCGYEALARWIDPIFGFMPPGLFIDTLEEFREIDKLDRCIIEQVCRDLRAEIDAGKEPVPVSLNFSRLDFELYDVPEFLETITKQYGVPSNLLDVEITESALTDTFDKLQSNMSRLRGEHFSLWLDDFGSGYSSLNVLKDFQFNVLKIDMVFLRGFEDSEKAKPILKSIVDLAHSLNMITLCEGVETHEQFEFLSSIGCDRAQGYHFGKPDATKQPPAAA